MRLVASIPPRSGYLLRQRFTESRLDTCEQAGLSTNDRRVLAGAAVFNPSVDRMASRLPPDVPSDLASNP